MIKTNPGWKSYPGFNPQANFRRGIEINAAGGGGSITLSVRSWPPYLPRLCARGRGDPSLFALLSVCGWGGLLKAGWFLEGSRRRRRAPKVDRRILLLFDARIEHKSGYRETAGMLLTRTFITSCFRTLTDVSSLKWSRSLRRWSVIEIYRGIDLGFNKVSSSESVNLVGRSLSDWGSSDESVDLVRHSISWFQKFVWMYSCIRISVIQWKELLPLERKNKNNPASRS